MFENQSIGYTVAFATATANAKGVSLNNDRGAVTQMLAQWFATSPDSGAVESECAAISAGYKDAAERGFKVGKTAAVVLQSQFRKISAAMRGEVQHGLTDTPVLPTYAKADDDSIIGFGHGSISKEYGYLIESERNAIQRIARLDDAQKAAAVQFADDTAERARLRAELLTMIK